jgi:hypothetical protein
MQGPENALAAAPPAAGGGALEETAGTSEARERRIRRALLVYRVCLGYTVAMTAAWVFLMATGMDGGLFFGNYRITVEQIVGFATFFIIFWVVFSYALYAVKRWLLRRVGLGPEDLRSVFSSRLEGFDLDALLGRHSERTLRIVDMIGRRGRFAFFAILGYGFIYLETRRNPSAEALAFGLQASLFDAMVLSWTFVLAFRSDGPAGRMFYGATARVLDGIQGRANVLCITTMWNGFKFVMIPIGLELARVFPAATYGVVYAFIWLSYAVADIASEVFGSVFGRHGIRVWGLGDINRKSWEGVLAAFACTLAVNLAIVATNGLPPAWWGLAVVIAVMNPLVELVSPRGTDDFTMATSNALVCLAFGRLGLAG